uniref:Uncharacterized protein n=1 Tax=Setaria viridis TaxID=4556 RepID=A0A4U6TPK2_SETVI|nr:hypothetical protein SEVIR_8G044800v2 [Setaria viridis]
MFPKLLGLVSAARPDLVSFIGCSKKATPIRMGGPAVVTWISRDSCSCFGRRYKKKKILAISNIALCMCIFRMMTPVLIGVWRK